MARLAYSFSCCQYQSTLLDSQLSDNTAFETFEPIWFLSLPAVAVANMKNYLGSTAVST